MASFEFPIQTPAVPEQLTVLTPGDQRNLRVSVKDCTAEQLEGVAKAWRDALLKAAGRSAEIKVVGEAG